jgi:hypothetical protein
MATVAAAVGDGAKLDPAGKVVLAEFLAANISAVGVCLVSAADVLAKDDKGHYIAGGIQFRASAGALVTCSSEVMADDAARAVLLSGVDTAFAAWTGAFATRIGNALAVDPNAKLNLVIAGIENDPGIKDVGEQLGRLYGEMAVALRVRARALTTQAPVV